jgi:hypothetical protein
MHHFANLCKPAKNQVTLFVIGYQDCLKILELSRRDVLDRIQRWNHGRAPKL